MSTPSDTRPVVPLQLPTAQTASTSSLVYNRSVEYTNGSRKSSRFGACLRGCRIFCNLFCVYVAITIMLIVSIAIVYATLYSQWSKDHFRPALYHSYLLDEPLLQESFSLHAGPVGPVARRGFTSSIVAIAHYLNGVVSGVESIVVRYRDISNVAKYLLLDESALVSVVGSTLDFLFGPADGTGESARIIIRLQTKDIPYFVLFLLFLNVMGTKLVVTCAYVLYSGGRLDNAHPRVQYAKHLSSGLGARAVGSHKNSIESLVFFGIGLLVALYAKADIVFVAYISLLVLAARILYHACYIVGLSTLRSYFFFIGFVATAMLYAVPIAHVAELRHWT